MWLSVKEVSLKYRLKRSTVYFWVKTGVIPHYRIGSLVRFRSDEIDEWLKSLKQDGRVERAPEKRTREAVDLDIEKTIRNAIDAAGLDEV